MIFAITLIHRSGGHSSCTGETVRAAQQKAFEKADYYARSCVVATTAYECVGGDCTMPVEIVRALGVDLMALYQPEDA